ETLREELHSPRQAHAELEAAKQRLAEIEHEQANLREQVAIAKQIQDRLTEDLKGLRTVKEEADRLNTTLRDRETALRQAQEEKARLDREIASLQGQLERAQADVQLKEQQAAMDRQGLELRMRSLERQLREARKTEGMLREELDGARAARPADAPNVQQESVELTSRLDERETIAAPAAPPMIAEAPAESEEPSRASMPDRLERQEELSAAGHLVKVHQVNEELDFLVLSVTGIEWVRAGAVLVLANEDHPVATVELAEPDREGFAIAQITHTMDPARQIRKGDVLLARPLLKPGAE
ncbi:MAG: hypothetical protein HYW10_05190, partial [Candidatus Omnitrophica bacterium]|nr:hypothetical protein [Candidatus Omnitrophota bacterium]